MSAVILPLRPGPVPQPCQACRERTGAIYKFAGTHCPICKEPRSTFVAVMNMAKQLAGVAPLTEPLPPCKYEPKALCDCGGRGHCLPAA